MATAQIKNDSETKQSYNYGTGRRKTAIAQVRVVTGKGKLMINDKEVDLMIELKRLLESVGMLDKVDVIAHVHGGGIRGQITAIRHGLARALVDLNVEMRPTLKKQGFLTRDSREKERKKYGLHGARRAQQFSKR